MELKEIQRVAKLARIQLTSKEETQFSNDLNNILNAFSNLNSVETNGLEPLVTPVLNETHLRADEAVEQSESTQELLLQSAPEVSGHLYRVPPVV